MWHELQRDMQLRQPKKFQKSRGNALTGVGFHQHLLAVNSCEDPQRFSSTSLRRLYIHGRIANMPLNIKLTACTYAQVPPGPAVVLLVLCLSKKVQQQGSTASRGILACSSRLPLQQAHLGTTSLLSALQCGPALSGLSSCRWYSQGYNSRLQDPCQVAGGKQQDGLLLEAKQFCISHFWAAVSSDHLLPKPPKWGSEKSCFRPSACILAHPIGSRLPVTRHVNTLSRACTP